MYYKLGSPEQAFSTVKGATAMMTKAQRVLRASNAAFERARVLSARRRRQIATKAAMVRWIKRDLVIAGAAK